MDRYSKLILDQIVAELGSEVGVFLFGSRARDEQLKFSDFDVGLYAGKPIPEESIRKINSALKESTLPFKVDLIDFYRTKKEFQLIALEEIKVWQNPSKIQYWIKNLKN
ncbi:nucleotidyltransferase domain-containing protein [Bdellovibrionales bacterium]|nr:nucleotidyltransferase domain-containing protein [Bdellovibrionales bacterium]